jgi:hypothetical protein
LSLIRAALEASPNKQILRSTDAYATVGRRNLSFAQKMGKRAFMSRAAGCLGNKKPADKSAGFCSTKPLSLLALP